MDFERTDGRTNDWGDALESDQWRMQWRHRRSFIADNIRSRALFLPTKFLFEKMILTVSDRAQCIEYNAVSSSDIHISLGVWNF